MEAKKVIENVGYHGFLVWFIYVLIAVGTSGCGILSGEMYIGTRRIDEVEQKQVMHDKPFKCMFVDCSNQRGS